MSVAVARRTAVNLGFEGGAGSDGLPVGWFRCGYAGYALAVDQDEARAGEASGCVRSMVEPRDHEFGGLGQCVDAEDFRGMRTRCSGWLRTESVVGSGAGLWMRVDLPDEQRSILDNMQSPINRAVTGTTGWTWYEVVLDVPTDATGICFGFLLSGTGVVWGDDLCLDVMAEAGGHDAFIFVTPAVEVPTPAHLPDATSRTESPAKRFYGREAEQQRFRNLLEQARAGQVDSLVMVLHGIGGIGKSTLV